MSEGAHYQVHLHDIHIRAYLCIYHIYMCEYIRVNILTKIYVTKCMHHIYAHIDARTGDTNMNR